MEFVDGQYIKVRPFWDIAKPVNSEVLVQAVEDELNIDVHIKKAELTEFVLEYIKLILVQEDFSLINDSVRDFAYNEPKKNFKLKNLYDLLQYLYYGVFPKLSVQELTISFRGGSEIIYLNQEQTVRLRDYITHNEYVLFDFAETSKTITLSINIGIVFFLGTTALSFMLHTPQIEEEKDKPQDFDRIEIVHSYEV